MNKNKEIIVSDLVDSINFKNIYKVMHL